MAINTSQAIESIAADIGAAVYLDIAKWHLYLRDAHLHTPLAEAFYPMLVDGNLDEQAVEEVLRNTSIKIGGGKRTLPLLDLIPSQGFRDLMDTLEECQRNL